MKLEHLPQHDVLHVISDIHMGGEDGFQILRETGRLEQYVRRLAVEQPQADVALVLNGDVFDTLAERHGDGYVAVASAQAVLARIMQDAAFAPVWDALAQFAQTARRTLVFVIGNHDIEIALPAVQWLVVQRLTGGDVASRARVVFSTTGAGYACRVGDARVYCIHGNEVDAWNFNRYEDLARLGRRLNAAKEFDGAQWAANAGTQLVRDVMNEVKSSYPWIDLLKPETSAAIGTLLAIEPKLARKIAGLGGVAGALAAGEAQKDERLSLESFAGMAPRNPIGRPDSWIGPHARASASSETLVRDMLLEAERSLSEGAPASPDATLGLGQLLVDRLTGWMRGIDKPEALRRALLDWLRGDRTFELDERDDTCRDAMDSVGFGVDIVVTGHTHLARALALDDGRLYLNSGTWIRLMQFTPAMLADEASFKSVYPLLLRRPMVDLDHATFDGSPLVLDRTTEVEILVDNGRTVARLNQIRGDGRKAPAEPLKQLSR